MDRKMIAAAAVVAGLLALHFLDRPSSPSSPNPAPAPSPRPHVVPPRVFGVACDGGTATIVGDDASGQIMAAADMKLSDGVYRCQIAFARASSPRSCSVTPGMYTATPGPGSLDVIGAAAGETISYTCTW